MTELTNENNAAGIQAAQANSTLNASQPVPQKPNDVQTVGDIRKSTSSTGGSIETPIGASTIKPKDVTSTDKTRETEDRVVKELSPEQFETCKGHLEEILNKIGLGTKEQLESFAQAVDKDGDGIIDAYDKEIKSREDISEEIALFIQDMKNAYGKKMWDMARTLKSVKSMLKTITGTEVSDKVANSVLSLLKRSDSNSNKGPGEISSVGSLGEDKTKAGSMDVAS